jgi:hypothetical protein
MPKFNGHIGETKKKKIRKNPNEEMTFLECVRYKKVMRKQVEENKF